MSRTSNPKKTAQKFAVTTLSAMVLGTSLVGIETVTASPNSSFGSIQSANAIELAGTSASIVGKNTIGTVSTDFVVANLSYGAAQNSGASGQTFEITNKDQNFFFTVADNPVGKKFTNPDGVEFAEVTASTGNGYTITLLPGADQVTVEQFTQQLNMRANGAKWNTTAGETKDLIFIVNGVEVNAGPVTVAPGSGTPNMTVKGGSASWRTMPGNSSANYAFDGRAAFEYKSTTPAELGKHAWGAISIPDAQKELITFNEDLLMQSNEGGNHHIKYTLTPTKFVEGTRWVVDTSKPVVTGSTKAGENILNFKWTGLDDQGRMTFEYDIPADQTYAIDIRTIMYDNATGTSYHGGYDLTKKGIVEKTTVAFGGRVDTVIADSANAPADQRKGWSPLGLHPQAFMWQDGTDFAVLYPKAINDTFTGDSGSTIEFNLVDNDTSMKEYGVTLNTESIELIVNGQKVGKSYTFDGAGTVTVDPTGKVTVKVVDGFEGAFPSFDYYIEDTNRGWSQANVTGTINAVPDLKIGLKTYINGEDANDKNNPVVVAPGTYESTYVISNPNAFAITSDQIKLPGAELGTFTIEPGATYTVKGSVNVEKQGTASLEPTVTATRTLASGKVQTATASDPAYVKSLTGTITTAPDETRVRVGETFSIPLLENDATDPEGHPLDPATIKLSATDGWVENEDGSFTNAEWGITGSVVNGNFEGTAGNVEGTVIAPNYTVENTLGDVSEQTGITIDVFDYHVDLEVFVGSNDEDMVDADDEASAYIAETITEEDVNSVNLNIKGTASNPGKDPVNVEKVTYKVKDLATGEYIDIIGEDGTSIGQEATVPGETFLLEAGESVDFTGTQEFGVGKYAVEYTLHTAEGVTDLDPIFVEVAKEIVPNEAPSHSVPEMPLPEPTPEVTPEPTPEPTPVQEKPKVKPFTPDTGEGLAFTAEKKQVVASDSDSDATSTGLGLLALLGAGAGASGAGFGIRRWFKGRKS